MLCKGEPVGDGYKANVVVAERLILEIKSVATILAVYEMQLQTYPRMSGIRVGLLLNFHAPLLMDGLRRYGVERLACCLRGAGVRRTAWGFFGV
jgi:GxxExxY protein